MPDCLGASRLGVDIAGIDREARPLAPHPTLPASRKRLDRVRQPPFPIAVLGKMLLAGTDRPLADALGDVRIFLQIPPFVDRHRKRQPAFEIAVVHEMLLRRFHRSVPDRLGNILIFPQIPFLVHLDGGDHHAQQANEIVIGNADTQLALCRGNLHGPTDQIEWRKVLHGASWLPATAVASTILAGPQNSGKSHLLELVPPQEHYITAAVAPPPLPCATNRQADPRQLPPATRGLSKPDSEL